MENLRQINDINYQPVNGDNIILNLREGILLNSENFEIRWLDNDNTEIYLNGWNGFIEDGGFILVI